MSTLVAGVAREVHAAVLEGDADAVRAVHARAAGDAAWAPAFAAARPLLLAEPGAFERWVRENYAFAGERATAAAGAAAAHAGGHGEAGPHWQQPHSAFGQ